MNKTFQDISTAMIDRYSIRYQKLGYNVKTLGWGDVQQQTYRFEQTLELKLIKEKKSFLDIGCGFGDYLNYLIGQKIQCKHYTGYDLNPDLINEARKQHNGNSNCTFKVYDILNDSSKKKVADIGIMLGVLNLNLKDKVDNIRYSKNIIKKALPLVNDCLVVDFLSNRFSPDYPKEDFVFYHDPNEMLDYALSLSSNVVLKHDYLPIPQKEFMLFIYK